MSSSNVKRLLGALIWIVLLHATTMAQITAGMRGTVSDSSGSVLQGANVTLVNEGTGLKQTARTDSDGAYTFTLLPVGTYKLEVNSSSFKTFVQTGITLSNNQVLGLNVTLQLGQVTEIVEVSGGASLVNTQTAEISTLIDERQIKALPLNGRNPIQLATLTNGVNDAVLVDVIQGKGFTATGNHLAVNGNQNFMTQYQLDGVDFEEPTRNSGLNYPNPDALQEFRFITNNYQAEFGKNPGGVMEVITKSGTNQIHGDVWEFNRNSVFAAKPYFQTTVPFLNQNQFGFDVGGPVLKNKLFIFGTAQWFRKRGGAAVSAGFPATEAERIGDFSAAAQPIIDPETGMPFPGNIIPTDRLDPIAVKYMEMVPLPNSPDGRFIGSFPEPTNNRQWMIKPDWVISDKQRLSGSVFVDRTASTSLLHFGRFDFPLLNTTGNPASDAKFNTTTIIANHIYNFTPTMLNSLRFSRFQLLLSTSADRGPTLSELGANFPTFPHQDIPNISPIGRWFEGTGNYSIANDYHYQISDSVSYVNGSHTIKFGAEYHKVTDELTTTSNDPGIFFGFGDVTGNPLADVMLGRTGLFVSNDRVNAIDQKRFAAYVQDDYRVSRNFMVNLGLRYQVAPMWQSQPVFETPDGGGVLGGATFKSGVQSIVYRNAPRGLLYPFSPGYGVGDPGVPSNLAFTHKRNFAPRLGVAWDVFGDGKTSLRSGWGIFYNTPVTAYVAGSLQGPPSFINLFVPVTDNFTDPVSSLVGVFPLKFTQDLDFSPFLPQSLNFLDPSIGDGVIQQFNLSVQHEFPGRILLDAAYVGNISQHLLAFHELNPAVYIPGVDAMGNPLSTVGNTDSRRPENQSFLPTTPYGALGETKSDSNSAYHSLQIQARVQNYHGLSLLTSYTWSKVIDFATQISLGRIGGAGQDPNNYKAERGLADFDRRHILSTSLIYNTPPIARTLLHTQNPVIRHVTDNWEITSIISLRSGSPFTVTTGLDNSLTGQRQDRPNLVGNPHLDTSRPRGQLVQRYFNTEAFAPNPIGTFGNVGRNTLIGPGFANVDFGLFKNIPFSEKTRLQLRVEFFNLFNRPNFLNPASILNDAQFGRILDSGPGRLIQLGGKFSF